MSVFAKRTNWDLRPNELAEALAKHRASGKPLIDLTISNPTECGFEYDTAAILSALQNPAALRYEPDPKGMGSAREAVAEYYADRGDRVSPEDILLTTSTSEAYSWAFRLLCEPGDEVLIPAPSYPLFDFLADIQDVQVVRYPLFYDHGWHYDLHALEGSISPRTRAVMVVHPNNPTGNYCKPDEMRRLNEICTAHELAIVADEVFLDYALEGKPRASFATNGTSGGPLTFTLSGLSKICGLPQMKVAWMVVSGGKAVKSDAIARLEMISDTYLSLNAPVQLAVPALLQTRHGFQRQVLERVRANVAEIDRQLSGSDLGRPARSPEAASRWSRLEIEGGWCVVLRIGRAAKEGDCVTEKFLVQGLYVHPGQFYELPSCDVVATLLRPTSDFEIGAEQLIQCEFT